VTLSFDETKVLIDLILNTNHEIARQILHKELGAMDRKEPEFYDGVIQHGPFMNYSAEQWFDFHMKVPHWRLRDEPSLMNKLSPEQTGRLLGETC
jgi:hypothetical protein